MVATSLIAAAWIGVALLGTHDVPGDGVMRDKAVSPPPRKETSEIKHPGIADTLSALSKPEFTRTRPGGENAPPDLQAETSPIAGKSAEADVSRVEADSE